MPFWSKTSTTLGNDQTYVNNTYKDANGNNKLSTITTTNPTGYVPVNANSTDSIVKNTSYAVQNDGAISYQYTDPAGGSRQFNSIQQAADAGIPGYTSATTAQVKDSMQTNLSTAATNKNVGSPTGSTDGTGDTGNGGESSAYDPNKTAATQKGYEENQKALSGAIESKSRDKYDDVRYPENIDTENQDYIKFSILKYEPSGFNLSNANSATSVADRKGSGTVIGNIIMAIQGPISDTNTVGYNEGPINAAQAIGGAAALATISGGAEGAGQAAGDIGSMLSDQNKVLKSAATAYFSGQAISNNDVLQRTTGAIANPNIELLFQAPQLRAFIFAFILSPRSDKESTQVRKIIRYFKQAMSVQKSSSGLFLKTPNTFNIKYVQKGSDPAKYLPIIKECALQSCSVDYTPAQTYSTFYNNSMTAYRLTLEFKELTPIYNTDYPDDKDASIGY